MAPRHRPRITACIELGEFMAISNKGLATLANLQSGTDRKQN
jgi:hypothetical protein